MSKCGKSFLPECEYFTTGGCISPFNCPYKMEHESITTATSTPLNSNVIYTDETYKDKEISRLTAENAELRERLDKAVEPPVKIGDKKYTPDCRGIMVLEETVVGVRLSWDETCGVYVNFVEARTQEGVVERFAYDYWQVLYNTYEAAEARLKELKEEEE